MTRHARDRATERYGVRVTAGDILHALCDIQHGRAILAKRNRDGTSEWFVSVNGQTMRAVLCAAGDAVVTVLPTRPNRDEILRRNSRRKGQVWGKPEPRRQRDIIKEMD